MITRIKTVLAYSNMTETQFAKKIGVTQSAFNRVIRGATGITLNIINSILINFNDISAEWLMRGDGNMLKGETQAENDRRLDNLVDVISMQQETIRNLQDTIKQLQNQ